MAKWGRTSIEVMARAEGWGKRSKDISYVAMAESGGDDKVINLIGCVGLLQINQPVHVKAHPKWTKSWLQDPMNNLRAGLVLYKAAGEKLDGPWLDSRDKGGGGGWGQHVKGSGGSTGTATPIGDEGDGSSPCDALEGTPGHEFCTGGEDGEREFSDVDPGPFAIAGEIGRLAQAVAKAGNWLADPANWTRVAYVAGGALLTIAAVNLVARPLINPAVGAVRQVIPVNTVRKLTSSSKGQ